MRRLEILQWAGLFGGALLWGLGHVVGFGITEAHCSSGGSGWPIHFDLWEGLVNGLAWGLALALLAVHVAVARSEFNAWISALDSLRDADAEIAEEQTEEAEDQEESGFR